MSGRKHAVKGSRVEREIVLMHTKMGVLAQRVPLSGAVKPNGNDQDVDVFPWGRENGPLVAQVKARKDTSGTKTVLDWLSDADLLFIRYDAEGGHARPPVVVMPWRVYERLVTK